MEFVTPMAKAVREAYARGEDDEQMEPLVLTDSEGKPIGKIKDGDTVIFYDIRGEREVEITKALACKDFSYFNREPEAVTKFVTMIEYHPDLPVEVAFPPMGEIKDTLDEVLANNKITTTKITETEKEVHLKYFFSGKRLDPFPGEDGSFVTSIKTNNYEDYPEMKTDEVVEKVIKALEDTERQVVIVNIPNVDVIGHIEKKESILKAVNKVDSATGIILEKAAEMGVTSIITADHGTVESWIYDDGTIDTGHTNSPVDFFIVEPDQDLQKKIELREGGQLIDVAPTLCDIIGIDAPEIWEGQSLLKENVYADSSSERVLLLIRDGWGSLPEGEGNLIKQSDTPVNNKILADNPKAHTNIEASGVYVGMPEGKVGNSEVGHIHLGSGRVIKSDRMRIEAAVESGEFLKNEVFVKAIKDSKEDGTSLHLMGIVSFYSSHGSIEHMKALLGMAKELGHSEVYIHGMLGRRGEKPFSGAIYTADIENECKKLGLGKLTTLMGRHWSLDREENWDRIEKTYNSMVAGIGDGIVDN